ncbi:DMT family transporter [Paenibacillus soyae]|uniref:DMT family transporter n=1 Tax=Paenibacillus soyae TaxID=2969249 RepID=A0A9X2SBP2_9BACL|nr:DMT family transporter [Paenibacillus soyae]MCR2805853.1 DMT family transporter [Paenibacillus soyae]
MKGWIYAVLGGGFIALQGAANARISADIGTWQAATITQFTGFVTALLIALAVGGGSFKELKRVKPLYLFGGAFAAAVIYSNVTAIQSVGLTLTVAAVLIAQLAMTFVIESRGWFGIAKQKMGLPQFIGIAMMIAGVIVLKS